MRQALLIGTAAALELGAAVVLPWPAGPFFAYLGASTGTIALAVATGSTGLMGKRADGSLPWWSWPLFGPWRVSTGLAAWGIRKAFPSFTEVAPGWWVGVWPHRPDLFDDWPAVVDLTCELPRRHSAPDYLCLPTWDQTAPRLADLERGVAFALAQRANGRPVLIHCAAGRGRSVTVLCAALVEAGVAPDWPAALALVQQSRPQARLAAPQQALLEHWAATRGARS